MSDLFKFDLQRFVGGVSAVIDDATVAVEGVVPASPEAGKYYFESGNYTVGTTFDAITIGADTDGEEHLADADDSLSAYYVINSVTGITLPGDAVAGDSD